mmetsp:Transcript_16832/g.39080  ORF Transcript_16832/g.39080 Transcript_16832/m.39080 type:complete len:242 (-) Transcript_16832:165-890(-)
MAVSGATSQLGWLARGLAAGGQASGPNRARHSLWSNWSSRLLLVALATAAWPWRGAFCHGSSGRCALHPGPWSSAPHSSRLAVAGEGKSQVAIEEQQETAAPEKTRQAGRLKGKAASPRPPRPTKPAAPPREEKGVSVPQVILGSLLALAIARLLLGFSGPDNATSPQAYYWSSSRSVVSVTTTDEYGDRRTTLNEDANVQTNIPGLKSYDRSVAPQEYIPRRALPPSSTLYPLLDFDTLP